MFENRFKGLFKLLDDTCKMQYQDSKIFVQNVTKTWENDEILVESKTKQCAPHSGFIIRHFAGDVFYNAVRATLLSNLNLFPEHFSLKKVKLLHFQGKFY